MDISSFVRTFGTEEKCVAHLARARWPDGPVCPRCSSVGKAGKVKPARSWLCSCCRKTFSVTVGTPLEHVRLPLPKVFLAIFLVTTASKGISSAALGRQIGTGQKTAWFLLQRIRAMLASDDPMLTGIVEADETYIGGKRRRGRTSKRDSDDDQPPGRAEHAR